MPPGQNLPWEALAGRSDGLSVRGDLDHVQVGTNKRYPHRAGQRGQEIELRAARTRGPLRTLDEYQLRLQEQPVTIVPERKRFWGLAWLQFGEVNVRCVVQVKRWTADAVGVEIEIDGDTLRCWVWQGACQRIEDPTSAW